MLPTNEKVLRFVVNSGHNASRNVDTINRMTFGRGCVPNSTVFMARSALDKHTHTRARVLKRPDPEAPKSARNHSVVYFRPSL